MTSRTKKLAYKLYVLAVGCTVASAFGACAPGKGAGTSLGPVITFDPQEAVESHPGTAVTLAIVARGRVGRVNVWMEGDYRDASLSTQTIVADQERSEFILYTPSIVGGFSLRARAEGAADATLRVDITPGSSGALRVLPSYAGQRPLGAVVASALPGKTCEELPLFPHTDAAFSASGFVNEKVVVANIPPGERVALHARISHYASGCTDVSAVAASVTHDVSIVLNDVPIKMQTSQLTYTLAFEPKPQDATVWGKAMDHAIGDVVTHMFGTQPSDAVVLLDEMASLVPAGEAQGEFAHGRTNGWEAKIAQWSAEHDAPLRTTVLNWLSTSKAHSLGPLVGNLEAVSDARVRLAPVMFGALTASKAGVTAPSEFSWEVDAQDSIALEGDLLMSPAVLVVNASDARPDMYVPGTADVGSALAKHIDCAGLAHALVAEGESYTGCDALCTATLCSNALRSLWQRARQAASAPSNDKLIRLSIVGSARIHVDDEANPVAYEGDWVADVMSTAGKSSMGGKLSGARALR